MTPAEAASEERSAAALAPDDAQVRQLQELAEQMRQIGQSLR